MKIKITKFRSLIVAVTILSVICFAFVLKMLIDYRVSLAWLAPTDEIVSTERLDKDIDTILNLYGLKKDMGDLLEGEGDSIYDMHYKNENTNGKSIFIFARTIFLGFNNLFYYTEIETLMEIWLYVIERDFEYDIDGITYYSVFPTQPFQGLGNNEVYMPRGEFETLYDELDIDNLPHHKKVKALTDAYIKKSGYKRGPGHMQVRKSAPNR